MESVDNEKKKRKYIILLLILLLLFLSCFLIYKLRFNVIGDPALIINASDYTTINVGDNYTLPSAIGKDYKGNNITVKVVIKKDGQTVDHIDTNVAGIYSIEYLIKDPITNVEKSQTITLEVKEKSQDNNQDGNQVTEVNDQNNNVTNETSNTETNNRDTQTVVDDSNNNQKTKDYVVIKSVTLSKTDWTNQDVVVSVNAQSSQNKLYYSFDGGLSWQDSNSFTVDSNKILNILVRDEYQNKSQTYIQQISNIDKTAPTIEVSQNLVDTKKVLVVVTAKDNESGIKEYSFDGGASWQTSNEKEFITNQTVNIIVKDNALNESVTKSIDVTEINNKPPVIDSVVSSNDNWTNQDVVLTVNARSMSSSNNLFYSFDNGSSWQSENTYTVSNNETVQILVKDLAQNISSVYTKKVSNIDKEIPTFDATENLIDSTKADITVNAKDNISGIKEYSFDGGATWQDSNKKEFVTNQTVNIVVRDNALNTSETKSVNITDLNKTAPIIAKVEENIKGYTNQDVILTVSATSQNSSALYYSFDNGASWKSDNTYTISQNQTLQILVKDDFENVSAPYNMVIANIDKEAPNFNIAQNNLDVNTVELTVNATDALSGVKDYSFDGGLTWQTDNKKQFDSNQTVNIVVRDNLLNISETKSIDITSINENAPVIDNVAVNPSDWTNQDAVLTVSATSQDSNLSYSFDNGITWQAQNTYTLTNNQAIYVVVKDSKQRVSESLVVNVTNIDKDAPIIYDVKNNMGTDKTTDNVKLTVEAQDSGSGIKEYSFDNGQTWQTDSSIYVSENKTLQIKVKDNLGNISDTFEKTVDNIDRQAPTFSVSGNPDAWQSNDAILNITATDTGAGLAQSSYSFDNGQTWQSSNTMNFNKNQKVSIKVKDALGNISDAQTVDIAKVDEINPIINSVITNDSDWLDSVSVVVNAVDNESGIKEYSFDGGTTWQTSNVKVVEENSTLQIKVKDNAQNESDIVSITVSNIDKTAPQITDITGNPTDWTNQDAILTVNATDVGSGVSEYSYDGGNTWIASNTYTVKENSNINVCVKDKAGNISDITPVNVNKIDKVSPLVTVAGNSQDWTNGSVTLIANASDDLSGIKEYSFDGGTTWVSNNTYTYHSNGIYSVKVRDNALNETTSQQIIISNIDTDLPSVVSVQGNPSDWTNQDVTLKLVAIDDLSGVKQFSFDNGITWQTDNSKIFTQNQDVSIKIKDTAQNISSPINVKIDKIDKVNPIIDNITGNATEITNQDITLTVNATDDISGIKEYSFDNGTTWQTSNTKIFSENEDVNILVKDNAGNISTVHKEIIDKISKLMPAFNVTGNPTTWTNKDVTLNIDVTDVGAGLSDEPYSFDNGVTWQEENYTTVSENKLIQIKIKDKAGNITDTNSQNITKIDKTSPVFTVTGNSTDWTSKVTLTVNATDNISGLASYSFDGGMTWKTSNTQDFTENDSIKICVKDNAGNVSQIHQENITKIDTQAPIFSVSQDTDTKTGNVTLTVYANDDVSGVKDYSFDGGSTWQTGNTKEFVTNQDVNIIVRDNALNESEVDTESITNIDKTPPVIDSVDGNPTDWTNQDVILTVNAHDNMSAIAKYSFDGGSTWQDLNSFTFNTNQIVLICVKDEHNDVSEITDVNINKIDKVFPTFNLIGNTEQWAKDKVVVSANSTDDLSGVKDYLFEDDGTWQSSNTYTYTKDGQYSIKVRDNAGNVTTDKKVLIVKIDTDSPSVISIDGNPTEWTNQDVTLSINSLDTGSGISGYSFNNAATWQTQNTQTFTDNQDVNIAVKDNVDNVIGNVLVSITKIDKVSPVINGVYGNSSTSTNQPITLSIDASDNLSGIAEYSFDNGTTWQTQNTKQFTSNQTVDMLAKDAAGNISERYTEVISNLDSTAPTFSIEGNATDWTNQDVTLTVNATDVGFGLDLEPYSFDDGQTWQSDNSFNVDSNQIISVRVKDKAGNISDANKQDVSKIDKTAPVITDVYGNTTDWVNSVTLAVTANDGTGSGIVQYSFDGGTTWQNSNSKEFTQNQNAIIEVRDAVGNISDQYEEDITTIDSVAPTFTVQKLVADTTIPVTLTVNATDNASGVNDYSFNNGYTWQQDFKKDFTKNQMAMLKVRDNAGNISDTDQVDITEVDDTVPVITSITGNPTDWTNQDVTLTVNATDDGSGLKEYSFDGGKSWTTSNSYTFNDNTTAVVYAKDVAGNISDSQTIIISKIDKIAPTFNLVADKTNWGNGSVTIKMDATDNPGGSGVAKYLFEENGTWQTSDTYTYTKSGQYALQAIDNAGNITTEKKMIIIDIDSSSPSVLSIEGNPTEWTNKDVTLTINSIDDGSGVSKYSFDNGSTWQTNNSKTFSSNQDVNIIIQDNAGNNTDPINVKIDKIDKVSPVLSDVTGNVDEPTNNTVTLSAVASDELSGIKEYSFDNGTTWQTSNTKMFSQNGTYIILAKDNANNVSNAISITIDKIDNTAPTINSVSGNAIDWVQKVTLSVDAVDIGLGIDDESGYSFDNGITWQKDSTKDITTNGIIYVKVKDKAGNISKPYKVTVDKVDTVPPVIKLKDGIELSYDFGLNKSYQLGLDDVTVTDNSGQITSLSYKIIKDDTEEIFSSSDQNYNTINLKQGKYTIRYIAIDSAQNTTSLDRTINIDPSIVGANVPILENGMIPIVWDSTQNSWVKADKVNIEEDWYSYDRKLWANAALVKENGTKSRQYYEQADVGTVVADADVLNYLVWIPRFKYRIQTGTGLRTIDIRYEYMCETTGVSSDTQGAAVTEYYTDPSFDLGGEQLSGYWIGKYNVTGTIASVTTRPNTPMLVSKTISQFFNAARSMQNSGNIYGLAQSGLDTHIIRNVDYGAITYLASSIFGTNKAVGLESNGYTGNNNYAKNINFSTTGNITGVYDMASSNYYQYVMAVSSNKLGSSGFTTLPDQKYYDLYQDGVYSDLSRSILGDATLETKDFGGSTHTLLNNSYPYLVRGYGSIYNSAYTTGGASTVFSTRIVITHNSMSLNSGLINTIDEGTTNIVSLNDVTYNGQDVLKFKVYNGNNVVFEGTSSDTYNLGNLQAGSYTVEYTNSDRTARCVRNIKINAAEVLNMPKLDANMIAVKWDGAKWIKVNKNSTSDWYSYKDGLWANAVLVKSSGVNTRDYYLSDDAIGKEVVASDILTYLVWIPRFKYRIPTGTAARKIDIEFEKGTETTGVSGDTPGAAVTEYYTHPSFTYAGQQLTGYWVGKFDMTGTTTTPTTLPNTPILVSKNISSMFNATRSMQNNGNIYGLSTSGIDSHLIKNTDYGAITYLSMSQYGANKAVTVNPNSYTGANNYIANINETTTGNITGVYDMASSNYYQYVMGNNNKQSGSSGFISMPADKYYDNYDNGTYNDLTRSILGDGENEINNFGSTRNLPDSTNPWAIRGYGSIFNSSRTTGGASNAVSSRIVITENNIELKDGLVDNMDQGQDNIVSLNDVVYNGQDTLSYKILNSSNTIISQGSGSDNYNMNTLDAGSYIVEYTNIDKSINCRRQIVIKPSEQINTPELEANMIPVKWDGVRWVKADKNSTSDWYSYKDKQWANAVLVKTSGVNTRDYYLSDAAIGKEVVASDILTYLVWIPRFKYRIPTGTGLRSIDIQFEKGTETTGVSSNTTGAAVTQYYTHPSFNFGGEQLRGYWVGKFNMTGTVSAPTTIANTPMMTSKTISQFFNGARSMQNDSNIYGLSTSGLDTHLIKNTDYGAITYLSMSQYGISSAISGTTNGYTGNNNYVLNTSESTTGNVYGVYDMSSSNNYQYVMAISSNKLGSSGFTTLPDPKYYDLYQDGSTSDLTRSILGDATLETKDFGGSTHTLLNDANPYLVRDYGSIFNSAYTTGGVSTAFSSRIIITHNDISLKTDLVNTMDQGTDNIVSLNDVIYGGQDSLSYKILDSSNNVLAQGSGTDTYNLKDLNAGKYTIQYISESGVSNCLRIVQINPAEQINTPKLDTNMIAVKWDGAKWIKVNKNSTSDWYSYKDGLWANAVLVKSSGVNTRDYYLSDDAIGKEVVASDILTYLVWIPRFKYRIPTGTAAGSIDIVFEKGTETTGVSNDTAGAAVEEYYTHPSFTYAGQQLTGYWVGKFNITGNTTTLTTLPNTPMILSTNISSMFNAARNMQKSSNIYGLSTSGIDSHLIKNTDYGAITYLSMSQYGANKAVTVNPNSYTGANNYIANINETTTGNITGVYDMANSNYYQYVMANNNKQSGSSGFVSMPADKYYDNYDNGTYNDLTRSILGDGENEINNFGSTRNLPDSTNPWAIRGYGSIFNSSRTTGGASNAVSSRIVITENNIELKDGLVDNMDQGQDNIVSLNDVKYNGQDTLSYKVLNSNNTVEAQGIGSSTYNLSNLSAGIYIIEYANTDETINCRRQVVITPSEQVNTPELETNMIPVKWDGVRWVKANKNSTSDWYSYKDKQWANAVLVKASGVNTRDYYLSDDAIGKEVVASDIITYLVWIPRFKYRIPTGTGLRSIDIQFENGIETTGVTNNTEGVAVDQYYTHPSFTFGGEQLRGYWVGKFDMTGTEAALTTIANSPILVSKTISQLFNSSRNMQNDSNIYGLSTSGLDTHLIKNTDYGAITYLSMSQYGITSALASGTNGYTGNNDYVLNTSESTTGNVYGIYDMSGGNNYQYVMAISSNKLGSSGFTTLPDPKYYDLYQDGSTSDLTRSILGDATLETKDFGGSTHTLLNDANPYLVRDYGSIFNSAYTTGGVSTAFSSRIIITHNDISLKTNLVNNMDQGSDNIVSIKDVKYNGTDAINYKVLDSSNATITQGSGENTYNLKVLDAGSYVIEYTNGDGSVKCTRNIQINPVEQVNAPKLDTNMVPVKWDGAKWIKSNKDSTSDWYSYKNGLWANAVLVKESGVNTRNYYLSDDAIGKEVVASDILTYLVWIPRFKYRIPVGTAARTIDIEFEKGTETTGVSGDTTSAAITEYYTHPSFTYAGQQLTGYWVGKFDMTGSTATPTTLPNTPMLVSTSISNMFNASRSMQNSGNIYGLSTSGIDSHLIKNTDYGAITYLSMSQYGANKSVSLNTSNYTGANNYIANINETTTGNITGVYDMANSGYYQYVMGNNNKQTGSSGFVSMPADKYYDNYNNGLNTDLTRSILGDGESEISTFGSTRSLPNSANPWAIRGYGSIFNSNIITGAANGSVSSRIVITEDNIELKDDLVNNMDQGQDNIVSLDDVIYSGQDPLSYKVLDSNNTVKAQESSTYNLSNLVAGTYTVEYANANQSIRCVRQVTIKAAEQVNVPVLDNNMIAVKWDGVRWIKANKNSTTDWYSYKDQQWANAVLVKVQGTNTRTYYLSDAANGKEVLESDILGYYVWVPRFKYRIPTGTGLRTIDVEFENGTETSGVTSNTAGAAVTQYYTHPAFTFGNKELTGIWVSKFNITGTIDSITSKPNSAMLLSKTLFQLFNASRNMQNSGNIYGLSIDKFDSHIIKNMDYGAITYLSMSQYGINKSISLNTVTTTGGGNYIANLTQSTTGNITGIYDMANSGYNQYIMGNNNGQIGSSGFTTLPDIKYYDIYQDGTYSDLTRSILGDAENEINNFGSTRALPYSANPWIARGNGSIFYSTYISGGASSTTTSKVVITP